LVTGRSCVGGRGGGHQLIAPESVAAWVTAKLDDYIKEVFVFVVENIADSADLPIAFNDAHPGDVPATWFPTSTWSPWVELGTERPLQPAKWYDYTRTSKENQNAAQDNRHGSLPGNTRRIDTKVRARSMFARL
jgi:hypothetical protein